MPPSGFSPEPVEGALVFARGCFEDLLEEVRSGKHKRSYKEGIKYEITQIEKALTRLQGREVVEGALVFARGCYKSLLREVCSGKHQSNEKAIEYVIAQIKKALTRLHIDAKGNLVER